MILASLTLAALAAGDSWTSWRGPGNAGVAPSAAPTAWSDDENVQWRVALPGRGFSTPLVLGDRVYVTTAVPLEQAPEPAGEGGGRRGRSTPQVENAFDVLALDRASGEVVWRKTCKQATPHEGYHRSYGSHASGSPVTDGERLYVPFGSFGLYCLDLDGELLWEQDLGVRLQMRNSFGEGHNPVLHDGTLIQLLDHEGQSQIVALDAATGKQRWRTDRDEPSCWATPLVTEFDGVLQVITAGTNRVRSYRLEDGKVLWECGGLGANAIPSVLRHGDLVLCMTGYRDPNLMAIRLGGEGDLTGSESIVWQTARATSYTASPVLHDDRFYAVTDRGFISCWDAATGKEHYVEERLPRGSSLKASPIAAGRHLYVATEAGDVHVIALGDEYTVVRTNTLADQFFVASPVVADGKLFLRSQSHLFCIAQE